MKKLLYLLGLIICFSAALLTNSNMALANGETINEDEVFSGGDTVVNQDQVVKDNVDSELKENHIGFSGQISANMGYYNFGSSDYITSNDILSNVMSTDLFLDIRLKQGVKGFLSLGVDYYPTISSDAKKVLGLESSATDSDYTAISIKEFFVDTNLQNKVYFRIGKQVLKWGQGYFWNPTDLINIEKKSFTDMDSVREGVFGIKTQVPFGVKQNIYLFTDMNDAADSSAVAQAIKYEFLLGNTEMSISGLTKEGSKPVFGFDFTSRLGNVDLRGEMSLSDKDYLVYDYDSMTKKTLTEIIPKACLGFTKTFDNSDINDRISITGEFYYNQAGYDKNILRQAAETGNSALSELTSTYLDNYYGNSKYYMALFSSISKFFGSDTALNLNAIMNLVDNSTTFIAGCSYAPTINNITIDFNVGYNFGDKYTESMLLGEQYYVSLVTTIRF